MIIASLNTGFLYQRFFKVKKLHFPKGMEI
jgi:hypothetical protein